MFKKSEKSIILFIQSPNVINCPADQECMKERHTETMLLFFYAFILPIKRKCIRSTLIQINIRLVYPISVS